MQANSSSHRKSDTFDTFDEIWDEAEDITDSCLHLDDTNSNYFLTFNLDHVRTEDNSSNIRCPAALDFNEVLALDRFRVHHKFHISPRHLPITPSNLLKSDINLHLDSAEDEDDRIPNDPDDDDTSSVTRLNNTLEDEAVNVDGSQSNNYGQVPIAGALFVATCLGTPVIALTGLKMGMFAAVGGGIMGFATGKMFAEHEEKQALARGELKDENNLSAKTKKKKTLRRIHEWQRFEANCQLVRDLDEEQLSKISEMHKQSRQSTPVLKPKKGKEKAS